MKLELEVSEWHEGCPEQLERGMVVEIKRRVNQIRRVDGPEGEKIETEYLLVGDINEVGERDSEGYYTIEKYITRYRYTDIWKVVVEETKCIQTKK